MGREKRWSAWALAIVLVVCALAFPAEVKAAGGETALNRTKVTLTEGASVQLKLNYAPKGTAVKWSSSRKSVAAVSQKGKVMAKKAGKAKITAAAGKKKYFCTVTVKEFPLTHTKGKNRAEVKALAAIIQKQNAMGAVLSTDLDDIAQYVWNADGNLTGLDWADSGLTGSLSLKGFPLLEQLHCGRLDSSSASPEHLNRLSSLDVSGNAALKILDCNSNQLDSLDVSKNAALRTFVCRGNQLKRLDVSNNPDLFRLECECNQLISLNTSGGTKLRDLHCYENQLKCLDVSGNPALEVLYCSGNELSSIDLGGNATLGLLDCTENQLSHLDLSRNTALEWLHCEWNQLTSLDLSKNAALKDLFCYGNRLGSLDLSNNPLLHTVFCDQGVTVTGCAVEVSFL